MNLSLKKQWSKIVGIWKNNKYLLEILIAFFVADSLNILFASKDLGWLKVSPHPYWLIILPLSSYYGLAAGILTGLVAALHIFLFVFKGIPSKVDIQQLIENHHLILPVTFIVVGMFLGEIRQKYIDSENTMKKNLLSKENEVALLKQSSEISEKAKRLLEVRIINQASTIKTLYEVAKRFESLEVEQIYKGCLEMLESYFQVQKSSIYFKKGDFLVLKTARGWTEGQAAEGKIPFNDSLMSLAFSEKKTVTVKEILRRPNASRFAQSFGELLAMFPIVNSSSEVVGVLNIEKMDFLSFHQSNLDLIELVVDWMSQALMKSEFYGQYEASSVWNSKYGIFNYNFFVQSLEREFKRAKNFNTTFTIALLKLDRFSFLAENTQHLISCALIASAKQCFPETDLIFKYRFDGTFALICPFQSAVELEKNFIQMKSELQSAWKQLPAENRPDLIIGVAEFDSKDTKYDALITKALQQWQKHTTRVS